MTCRQGLLHPRLPLPATASCKTRRSCTPSTCSSVKDRFEHFTLTDSYAAALDTASVHLSTWMMPIKGNVFLTVMVFWYVLAESHLHEPG